jgi:hypothetical protein
MACQLIGKNTKAALRAPSTRTPAPGPNSDRQHHVFSSSSRLEAVAPCGGVGPVDGPTVQTKRTMGDVRRAGVASRSPALPPRAGQRRGARKVSQPGLPSRLME